MLANLEILHGRSIQLAPQTLLLKRVSPLVLYVAQFVVFFNANFSHLDVGQPLGKAR